MKTGFDLTEGPILKKFIQVAVPILLNSFLGKFYNIADTVIVGKFAGDGAMQAIAAVGTSGVLVALIVNLFMGLSVGSNVVCANCYGARDYSGFSKAMHTSIVFGVVLGIPIALFGWFISEPLLRMMDTPDDVIGKATLYMKIYFSGTPVSMISWYTTSVLRAIGDTKKPLYILIVSGMLNVVLNIVCVVGFKMDVAGVAIGTVASQLYSAVSILIYLTKIEPELRLDIKKLRLYGNEAKRILKIGIPAGMDSIMFSLSNTVIQSAVNSFGSTVLAANSVALKYNQLSDTLIASGKHACVSFVGQNMGARNYDRVKKVIRTSMIATSVITIAFDAIIVLNSRFFLGFFTNEVSVIDEGIKYLAIVVAPFFVLGISDILGGSLRGMGYNNAPMLINLMGVCLFRVAWVLLVLPLHNTYEMLLLSYPASWIVTLIATLSVYAHAKRRVLKQ